MPTYKLSESFKRDYAKLTQLQKSDFQLAVRKLIEDLRDRKGQFRKGLRVKPFETAPGVYELTWASDGRATFAFGKPVRPGQPHTVWRRCGDHSIFKNP